MEQRNGVRWVFLRRWSVAAFLVGLASPLHSSTAQTSYTYTAEMEKAVAGEKRPVTAGPLRWDCVEGTCTVVGFWPSLGIKSCQALAAVAGPIKSFGRPGAVLDAAQLRECNTRRVEVRSAGGAAAVVGPTTARTRSGVVGVVGPCADCDGDGHAKNEGPPILEWHSDEADYRIIGGEGYGDDCDDSDRTRYPGNTEICDSAGHDEDCDLSTVGALDEDSDGYINATCINVGGAQGNDCDDNKSGVHPNVPEVCNGWDDNCDGHVDEEVAVQLWTDHDHDGFGDPGAPSFAPPQCVMGNMAGRGLSTNDYDCDDTNPRRNPVAGCPH